jgi:hypothetical protein
MQNAANYPAPREIPAGHVLISEYGDADKRDSAILEKVAEAFSAHVAVRAMVRLEWSSPGWEIAGSMLRWTNGYWACRWTDRNGCTQGQRYKNDDEGRAKARAHFDRLTSN